MQLPFFVACGVMLFVGFTSFVVGLHHAHDRDPWFRALGILIAVIGAILGTAGFIALLEGL